MMEPRVLAGLVRDNKVDAVVGATLLGSFALARAGCELPFWADQFGHSMAEAQAKAALVGNNRPLAEPGISCGAWVLLQTSSPQCRELRDSR